MKNPKSTATGGPLVSLETTERPDVLAVVWMAISTSTVPISGYRVYLNGQMCGNEVSHLAEVAAASESWDFVCNGRLVATGGSEAVHSLKQAVVIAQSEKRRFVTVIHVIGKLKENLVLRAS